MKPSVGILLSGGVAYDPENPAHRKELADKLTQKLGTLGFTLSEDRTRDPGRKYGGGFKGREQVYVFKHRKDPGLEVQIFTSVLVGGDVRGKGADAIRVCLVYKNKAKQLDPESEEARQYDLGSGCRVYRTGDIDDIVERTLERARDMYRLANTLERCNNCQAPLATSKAGKKFCSEVCWTKRPGYTPKASAVNAAVPLLRKQDVANMAKKYLKDAGLASSIAQGLTAPQQWPFVASWPKQTWQAFFTAFGNAMKKKPEEGEAEEAKTEARALATAYALLEAAATSLENGVPQQDVERWLSRLSAGMSLDAVKIGEHPDLFAPEPTAVVVEDWKQSSPDALLAAARRGNMLADDELEEMSDLETQADEDGTLDKLLALGMSQQLAQAVANGLHQELLDADEAGRKERIKPFIDCMRERAKWEIEYRTEGDGSEYLHDGFQTALDDKLPSIASKIRGFLEEEGYNRIDSVSDGTLEDVVSDPSLYELKVNKNESRLPKAVYSANIGSVYLSFESLKYDEEREEIISNLGNKDLERAAEILENEEPFFSFGRWRGQAAQDKEFFSGGFDAEVTEPEGWTAQFVPDLPSIIAALNERLGEEGEKSSEPDTIAYTYAGTNDTIAGASAKGMYVVALRPDQLGAEGAALGICVGRKNMPYCRRLTAGEIDLYSIRTEAGKPKFTIEIDKRTNEIVQVKGKANRIPGFASHADAFTKTDEVRLVVEFLRHLGYSVDDIRHATDMRPGIRAMEDAGQDPFSKPVTKKRGEVAARADMVPASALSRRLARMALARPWGFDQVEAAVADRAVKQYEVANYAPFTEWLDTLRDPAGIAAIISRIKRAKEGNFGDHRVVRKGLYELKIDQGPGYRIYFTDLVHNGKPTVILLTGGTKKSQDKDIREAEVLVEKAKNALAAQEARKQEEEKKQEYRDYGKEYMPKPMFAHLSDEEMLAAGVPEDLLTGLRGLLAGDDDGLLEIMQDLPLETGELLLKLALDATKGDIAVSGSTKLYWKMMEVRCKRLLI